MLAMVPTRATTFSLAPAAVLGVIAVFWGAAAIAESRPSTQSARAQDRPRKLEVLKQRDLELETLRVQQQQAAETEAGFKRELEAIGDDRRKLNQALLDTAARLRSTESKIADSENRLRGLEEKEHKLRDALAERRSVIAEVLAALQRMGRHPPPAMVSAEDTLAAVRSAIMLGAILPAMRGQAETLASELTTLVGVRRAMAEEQEKLLRDLAALAGERVRTARLVEERQKKQADTEKALESERQRAAELARQTDSLKDLIARLELNLDRAGRAQRSIEQQRNNDSRPEMAAFKDPGRLAPALAFAATRGRLQLPAVGLRIREFGAADGQGGTEKGLSIATKVGAQVTSPCDGWVVYASPFRNYGQVLILDAGDGYHVVLAGMDRISVRVGQFVLTGEPVATMGNSSQMAASVGKSTGQSVLYVEFRKDGAPIDSSPWWATSEGEKVRG